MRLLLSFLLASPLLFSCTDTLLIYSLLPIDIAYALTANFTLSARTTSYDGSNGNGPVTIQATSTGPLRNLTARLTGNYGSNTNSTVALSGELTATSGSGTFSLRNFCGTFPSNRTDTFTYTVVGGVPTIIPTWGLNAQTALSGDPVSMATRELVLNNPVSTFSAAELRHLPGPRLETYYASFLKENGVNSALGNNMMHNFDLNLALTATTAQANLFRGRRILFNRSGNSFTPAPTETLPHQLVAANDGYLLADLATGQTIGFNTQGQLTSVLDGIERIEVIRGPSGPTRLVSSHGGSIDFIYNSGLLSSIRSGPLTLSLRHQDSNLVEATDALSRRTTFSYTSAGTRTALLTGLQYPNGNRPWTQTYDAEGRLASQTDSAGNVFNFTTTATTASATTVRFTGPLNFSSTYIHDSFRNFNSLADPSGLTFRATWDNSQRLLSLQNRLNLNATFSYTPQGLPSTATDFRARTTTYSYTPRTTLNLNWFDLTTQSTSTGNTTRHTFDAEGRRTSLRTQNATWEFTYRPNGQPASTLLPLGGRALYEYDGNFLRTLRFDTNTAVTFQRDANQLLTGITFPDNASRTYEFDLAAQPIRFLDENRAAHNFTYHPNGFLSRYADPSGASWTYDYDTNNRLQSFTLPLGGRYRWTFDALGRYRSFLSPTNLEYNFTYNTANQLTGLTGPASTTFTFTPNAAGSITSLTVPLLGTFTNTRDNAQRITSFTTPLNQRFTATYNGMDQIWTDPLGTPHSTPYDPDPFPRYDLSAFSPNLTTNALRQPTSWQDAAGGSYSARYSSYGLPTQWSFPAGTANIEYNNRWLPSRWSTGDWFVQQTYDPAGLPLAKNFSDQSSLNFEYDSRQLLRGGTGLGLSYNADAYISSSNGIAVTRDAANQITGLTYAPGKSISIRWDPSGLPLSLTDWTNTTLNFSYNAARLYTGYSVGNLQTTYGYDGNGSLQSAAVTRAGASLFSTQLTRNAAGQITSETRSSATIPDLPLGVNGTAYNTASQPVDTTHDALGRLSSQGTRRYQWTGLYLGGTTGPDGDFAFTYNNQGDRTSRTANGQTEQHIRNYALPGAPLTIIRSGGNDQRYFVFHPFGFPLFSVNASNNTHLFHHFDPFGNLALLTNDSGNVAATYAISLYGESVQSTGTAETPFTWRGAQGVEQEGNTGLYYRHGEYFDSTYVRNLRPSTFGSGFAVQFESPYYARTFGADVDANPFTPAEAPALLPALLNLYFGPRRSTPSPTPGLPTSILRARDFGTSSLPSPVGDSFEHKPADPFDLFWYGEGHHKEHNFCSLLPPIDSRLRFSFGARPALRLEPEAALVFRSLQTAASPSLVR